MTRSKTSKERKSRWNRCVGVALLMLASLSSFDVRADSHEEIAKDLDGFLNALHTTQTIADEVHYIGEGDESQLEYTATICMELGYDSILEQPCFEYSRCRFHGRYVTKSYRLTALSRIFPKGKATVVRVEQSPVQGFPYLTVHAAIDGLPFTFRRGATDNEKAIFGRVNPISFDGVSLHLPSLQDIMKLFAQDPCRKILRQP